MLVNRSQTLLEWSPCEVQIVRLFLQPLYNMTNLDNLSSVRVPRNVQSILSKADTRQCRTSWPLSNMLLLAIKESASHNLDSIIQCLSSEWNANMSASLFDVTLDYQDRRLSLQLEALEYASSLCFYLECVQCGQCIHQYWWYVAGAEYPEPGNIFPLNSCLILAWSCQIPVRFHHAVYWQSKPSVRKMSFMIWRLTKRL